MKKTEVIKLADGKEYTLTTLNVGDLIELEEKFGSIEVDTNKTKNMIYWIFLSIKKVHKDMTLEALYELIDAPFLIGNGMQGIFETLGRLNGWDKVPKNALSPVVEK